MEQKTIRLEQIKVKLSNSDFLQNKGLSNEVGIHVLCYAPEEELQVQNEFAQLQQEENGSFHLVECDLYKIFLSICEEKRILQRIPAMEEKKGSDFLLGQLQGIASPELFVQKMQYEPHKFGDVLLITGVGAVYPYMRVHKILDNMQPFFSDIPILVLYPGKFNGQELDLFGNLNDGNYYRAFQLF